MSLILDLIYVCLLLAASPWLLVEAVRKGKYREGFAARLLGRVPVREGSRPCVWLHAVSVGEVNLLSTLLAELRRRHPEWECVVSTTTMTGYALAKKKYATLSVFYCPLDFSWAVRTAMRRIRPDLLLLAELELWPNLVRAAQASGARVAIINGRLSEHSFRGYLRLRPFFSWLLRKIDLVAVQDAEYAERFRLLGAKPETIHVTGSIKYDGAQTDPHNASTSHLRQLAGFKVTDVIFLAGSTQEPEESMALATYRELALEFPQLRLVIVPRHPDRFNAIIQLLSESGLRWQRRTELDAKGADPESRVLLVDVVGELGAWWGTARIAFVGGSFGNRGGQNMIEPAAYGAAVSFGPNTRNFRDIVAAMLAHYAAVVVRDQGELTDFVRRCLEDAAFVSLLGERARSLVASQLGATSRTGEHVAALLERTAAKVAREAA